MVKQDLRMLRFMYHNLLDCGTKTLDFPKNFI